MATLVSDILTQARNQLQETSANFWSDDELVSIMQNGAVDLWGGILDLHQDHYFKVDEEHPILLANTSEISGLPEDCFRIQLIEPADTTVDGSGHQVIFVPRKYKDTDFAVARTISAVDPSSSASRMIYYQVTGLGPPIEAPHIVTAPKLSADLKLRVVYNPSLAPLKFDSKNPVPGGSDNALKAWTIAYARAKETDEHQPDPGWLSVYATEKQLILTRLTPREEQEPEIVEDLFQGFGSLW
jgi:hypothetical protein